MLRVRTIVILLATFVVTAVLIVRISGAAASLIGLDVKSNSVTQVDDQESFGDSYIEFQAEQTPEVTPVPDTPTPSTVSNDLSPLGFIIPQPGVNVGVPGGTTLTDINVVNDGSSGVILDQNFINQHQSKSWLKTENGKPVIEGVRMNNHCLYITTAITIRNSSISCPTRTQSDKFGYVGTVDDAGAINTISSGIVLERNTITCTGFDQDICSKGVRAVGSSGALITRNDISGGRAHIEVGRGTIAKYNYLHGSSFGADRRQQNSSNNGGVTHNNVIHNQGYPDTLIEGNYIEAKFGRVSKQPNTYKVGQFLNYYQGGVIKVGQAINGFVFTNYRTNGDGSNNKIINNAIEGGARLFGCQNENLSGTCFSDLSSNYYIGSESGPLDSQTGSIWGGDSGTKIVGRCNARLDSVSDTTPTVLPGNLFGSYGSHQTSGC